MRKVTNHYHQEEMSMENKTSFEEGEIVYLHQIPRGSSIKVTLKSGREVMATFHHLDGMYSYCTLNGNADSAFHLSVMTPLRKFTGKEGDYYVIVEEANPSN